MTYNHICVCAVSSYVCRKREETFFFTCLTPKEFVIKEKFNEGQTLSFVDVGRTADQSINHMFGETLTWQKLNLKVEISFKKK